MTDFRIIGRPEWGAKYAQGNPTGKPHADVHIHTEAGAVRPADWPAIVALASTLQLNERERMQAIERYHVVSRGWSGIGYSFVIHFDGSILEGRGWRRWGGHTLGHNDDLGICFVGHGDLQPATDAQWAAATWLIREGIRLGHISPSYKVFGHRDSAPKSCPGNLIYPHIGQLRGLSPTLPSDPKELFTVSQYDEIIKEIKAAKAEANESRKVGLIVLDLLKKIEPTIVADYQAQLITLKEQREADK